MQGPWSIHNERFYILGSHFLGHLFCGWTENFNHANKLGSDRDVTHLLCQKQKPLSEYLGALFLCDMVATTAQATPRNAPARSSHHRFGQIVANEFVAPLGVLLPARPRIGTVEIV